MPDESGGARGAGGSRACGAADRLTIDRLPGERGPLLRCSGALTQRTADVLRRELERLEPMGHAVLTIDLSGCSFVDAEGLITLLESHRRLQGMGGGIALVAGGALERLLRVLGIDEILPVFPREAVAARALRGAGPRAPAPATWEEARERTLERWRRVEEALAGDPEEALRLMTSMLPLCELSEELFEERAGRAHARCEFCPLFYALGGRREDLGCRSAIDPILDAVRAGDLDRARVQIGGLRRTIARMPVLEGSKAPRFRWTAPEQGNPDGELEEEDDDSGPNSSRPADAACQGEHPHI